MSDCAVSYKRSKGCVLVSSVSENTGAFSFEQVNANNVIETSSKNYLRQDYNEKEYKDRFKDLI